MNDHPHLDNDCIFCKIIRGEIPSFKVFEDERVFAFMDINPIQPGHSLVIPKFHTENIFTAPDDWAAATINGVQRLARAVQKTVEPDGINILQANGPGAAQSVFHIHMHVVPRAMGDEMKMNWGIHPGDMGEIEAMAGRICGNLD